MRRPCCESDAEQPGPVAGWALAERSEAGGLLQRDTTPLSRSASLPPYSVGGITAQPSFGGWFRANMGHSILPPNMLYNGRQFYSRDPMISCPLNHIRLQVLVVFLVALGLLCAGLRVPDLARPQRPKPSQRAVVENQLKSSPDHLKLCCDLVPLVPEPPRLHAPVFSYLAAAFRVVAPQATSAILFSNSGRSPPVPRA